MTQRISSLKNIGVKTEVWFHEIGIFTVEELETAVDAMGVIGVWQRIKDNHPEASLVGLYALQGALLNIHWNALPEEMKADLKTAYATLK